MSKVVRFLKVKIQIHTATLTNRPINQLARYFNAKRGRAALGIHLIQKGLDYRTRNSCMQDQTINSKFRDQPRFTDQFTRRVSYLFLCIR